MKKHFTKYLSVIAIIVALLLTGFSILFFFSFTHATFSILHEKSTSIEFPIYSDHNLMDTAFGGLFASYSIPDSLPYRQYKKIQDSLNLIKQYREQENKSSLNSAQSWGELGIAELTKPNHSIAEKSINYTDDEYVKYADTISRMEEQKRKIRNKDSQLTIQKVIDSFQQSMRNKITSLREKQNPIYLYYLTLSGYHLPYETKFYVAQETYHLAFVKWDTLRQGKDTSIVGHYLSKPIQVRYATDENKILIPISKNTYEVLKQCLNILPFLIGFVFLYFFLGLPIQLLINISRGEAFKKKNIFLLRSMAWVSLLYSFFYFLTPYLLGLVFRKRIPADFFRDPIWNTLMMDYQLIFYPIALYIISKAFQKGYELQKEQELTI